MPDHNFLRIDPLMGKGRKKATNGRGGKEKEEGKGVDRYGAEGGGKKQERWWSRSLKNIPEENVVAICASFVTSAAKRKKRGKRLEVG